MNRECLQGCILTFVNLLDVFDEFAKQNARVMASHYSLIQMFANLACDMLIHSLSIDDQLILSPSLELLSRIVQQFDTYCKNWRREKGIILLYYILTFIVSLLFKKLYSILRASRLITVNSHVLNVLERSVPVFPLQALSSFRENNCKKYVAFL